jgi:hypothetical protein
MFPFPHSWGLRYFLPGAKVIAFLYATEVPPLTQAFPSLSPSFTQFFFPIYYPGGSKEEKNPFLGIVIVCDPTTLLRLCRTGGKGGLLENL